MAEHPVWARPTARARGKTSSPLIGILFVLAMGAAFWIGAIWASQSWWPVWR